MFFEAEHIPDVLIAGCPECDISRPEISFSYSLEEKAQIKSLPRGIEIKTKLETRLVITEFDKVSVIGKCTGFHRNDTVSVQVCIHYVTGSPVCTKPGLTAVRNSSEMSLHLLIGFRYA